MVECDPSAYGPAVCLVCGGAHFAPHLEILLKCRSCGFVTARMDSPINARQLYDGDYFTGEEYLDYKSDEAFFKKNFRKRLREIMRHKSSGRLLEIGAAYGFFLDLARQHFDVLGYEVNQEAARFGREKFGIDTRTSDFLRASDEELGGSFDVVVMWDVIEHLERPDLFIAKIAGVCKPGAQLCVTTGDIGSRLARWRGQKWRMIHPPTHLHYFDRHTLPRLLGRFGFRTIDVHSVSVARSIRQVLYSILVLKLGLRGAYEAGRRFIPPTWGFTLNTFDIMQVTARRDKQ